MLIYIPERELYNNYSSMQMHAFKSVYSFSVSNPFLNWTASHFAASFTAICPVKSLQKQFPVTNSAVKLS